MFFLKILDLLAGVRFIIAVDVQQRVGSAVWVVDRVFLDGVGMDSLELLQFMLELEERLAIQIDFDRLEYSYLHSIQMLAEFLATMPPRRAPASIA